MDFRISLLIGGSRQFLAAPLLAALGLGATSCGNSSSDSPTVFGTSGGANTGATGSGPTSSGGTSSSVTTGGTGVVVTVGGATSGAAGGASGPCKGLECQRKTCASGATTTISGRVFDPSGTLPIYNVMVYVPNAPLAPMTPGANCMCEVSGEPVASALTDTNGHFSIPNAPIGGNIPLVIQVGKWRRSFVVPTVAECTDTPVADQTLRLPARQSEGDMPKIALTTGASDALECLIRKLGIDPAEFTNPDGPGRINYFAGHGGTNKYAPTMNGGASFPAASTLWGSVGTLQPYDVVLLSCEGGEFPDEKGAPAFQAMHDYAGIGGRVFASHWHEVWFKQGPAPWPSVAQFVNEPDIGNLTADVVTSFPKGQALSQWLINVQASTTPATIAITAAQHTVVTENPMYAQRWIASSTPQSAQYLSANTPFEAEPAKQCGRVVLSDIHVSGGAQMGGMRGGMMGTPTADTSGTNFPFPNGCVTTGLSPQEKVLAFMLFDITACLIPDDEVPVPPTIVR